VALHEDRRRAESFGDDPLLYDRVRPGYPPELVDDLVAESPADVLDVGCGTGMVSRLFLGRGCQVLGVEADPRMAEVARQLGCQVEVSRFEEWEPADRSFDLVVSGQAWHWVEPESGARAAAVCLRSGGRFAAFWNETVHSAETMEMFLGIYRRLAPKLIEFSMVLGTARPYIPADPLQDPTVLALVATGEFHSPARKLYRWQRRYAVQDWLGLLRTASDHRQLSDVRLAGLLAELERQLEGTEELRVGYETRLLELART